MITLSVHNLLRSCQEVINIETVFQSMQYNEVTELLTKTEELYYYYNLNFKYILLRNH